MFMFLYRRNRDLQRELSLYVAEARRVFDIVAAGLAQAAAVDRGEHADLAEAVRLSHAAESECDRIRRQIERDLFEKSLLPEAREDIMTLLECLDLVVNQAEDVLRQIVLQHLVLPAVFRPAYADLGRHCHETAVSLLDQADAALANDPRCRTLGDAVKAGESRIDHDEQGLIGAIFASDLALAEKLHYRDLVSMTAAIGDLAEDAANLLTVFMLKREA